MENVAKKMYYILHRSCQVEYEKNIIIFPNGTWETWDDDLKLDAKKQSGKTYKSVYGRMAWDEPSPTITTQFYNYGTGRFDI